MQHEIDLLLHPRVPPLVRSLPHVEALSLFHAEENQEERDARQSLSLSVAQTRPSEAPSQVADISITTPPADMVVDSELSNVLSHTTGASNTVRYGMTPASIGGLPAGTIPASAEASIETQRTNVTLTPSAPSASVQAKTPTPPSQWLSANATPSAATSTTRPLLANPLPPPVPLLGATKVHEDRKASLPAAEQEAFSMHSNEEDEPMPTINMESDSESD